jgi:hypothetical protein
VETVKPDPLQVLWDEEVPAATIIRLEVIGSAPTRYGPDVTPNAGLGTSDRANTRLVGIDVAAIPLYCHESVKLTADEVLRSTRTS